MTVKLADLTNRNSIGEIGIELSPSQTESLHNLLVRVVIEDNYDMNRKVLIASVLTVMYTKGSKYGSLVIMNEQEREALVETLYDVLRDCRDELSTRYKSDILGLIKTIEEWE